MTPQEIALYVYNLALLPVIFFSVMFIILSFINLFVDRKEQNFKALKNPDELPFVSVQIPTFNDPVAERCVRHCMEFDYPRDKYEIIITDDSTSSATQQLLKGYADKNREFVKYIHRDNREGFKPGALKNAMKVTKGEIIVVFDSDWMPGKDFLSKIIQPFSDPKVAIVQSTQGFYNKNKNLISRFAAYVLMAYHSIVMPINNRVNSVFFCGTAGALRRSAMEEVGGWNINSITEDSDLSVRLLLKGYKSVYLKFKTPSEVPETFESFIKQQMRWCYGNTRVFFDRAYEILFKNNLTFGQKMAITNITLGNVIAPIVVIMTIFGFMGWFLGDPTLFNISDFVTFMERIALTAGFLVIGIVTLYKNKQLSDFPYFILSSVTVGLVLAMANSIAFFRAVTNKKLRWFCTEKSKNEGIV